MDDYTTGNGPQQIDLTVDVDTIGMAATRAHVAKTGPGNPQTPVAQSNDVTGDIAKKDIGSAANLQGQSLYVSTLIDLRTILNQPDREREFARLSSTYILDNGTDGHQVYAPDDKVKNADCTTIILFKQVNLNS